MKKYETFIGECSKFIDGKGLTTKIPISEIEKKGYKKIKEDSVILSREEAERFRGQTINLKKVKAQTRKEIAQQFYDLSNECGAGVSLWKKVRQLAKDLGVEEE